MDEKENSNVRITGQAHGLLAEMARDCDTSMKDIASEAITRMANRTRDERQYKFGAFALGAIAGGMLMFFIGVAL